MEHGNYNGYFTHWINKCDEVANIESFLSTLTEYEREIFWDFLEHEIQEMEAESACRKYFTLSACDPKRRVDMEKESFKTEYQIQCESVFERWGEYKESR